MVDFQKRGEFKKNYPDLKDKKIILFLGRTHPKKGLDILIDSFKDLSNIRDDLYLVIVGPDNENYKEDLIKIIKSYGLQNKIIFTGFLHGYDKLSILVDSDVFVLPSYSDNFGISVIEAMACGTPVIVTENTGSKEAIIYGETGVIIPTGDVDQLKKKTLLFYKNKGLIHKFGLKSSKLAEQYTRENYRTTISKVLLTNYNKNV